MKSKLIYIDEKDLNKFGNNTFIAFYNYQNKFCLAIFNETKQGSIISFTPYFDTIKDVLGNFKFDPKNLGQDYFENFVIVHKCRSVSHL